MPLPAELPAPRMFTRDSAPSLRWGILAPGNIAAAFTRSVLTHTDQRVVAVGSRSIERASSFSATFAIESAYGSYEQLVADPQVDVVYIAAPASEHLALALLAINAGKPVLVEKPFTTSAQDARILAAAARERGVFAMEAMWTRYLPQFDVVRQLIADGVLGRVESLLADHGQAIARDPAHRLYRPELGGGALFDLGIYPVALSSELLGCPSRVTAAGAMTTTGVDAYATIALEHPGNRHATISTGLLTRTPITAAIGGSEARIEIATPFFTPTSITLADNTMFGERVTWSDPTVMRGLEGLSWQATAAASYITDGRTESPLHTLTETISILETLEEARRQVESQGLPD
ncbi:putative dehydrogenase [Kibdelosporangium banguiense]|uniref:Dehydrogenase n=1 Tax=Kibdelosporangium banguiense TaxID=1365924 RepID=A0ABS4TV42_9PSEU|nr:Gfo/Idh/MocA family oxidoreductase [Kibdelosporangium banguiense]MBP2328275.1 putative dehydrogenase [Kibdelosporangium banguiense]